MITRPSRHTAGFTIVELIVVIVVIAILAAMVTVSYVAITRDTVESGMKSDLEAAAGQLREYRQLKGSYPIDAAEVNNGEGLTAREGSTIAYTRAANRFCVSITSSDSDAAFYIDEANGTAKEGSCPNLWPSTMQAFTRAHCASLPEYTGSNDAAAIKSLADSRGGTTQTYRVARFGDACWMIDNLKLGSTTGAVTLTAADSDVESTFVLPQVAGSIAGTTGDVARVYGPVPGDVGSEETNYGYLYSWTAVTAGETRTSLLGTSGNAPYSICAKGWRLPLSGVGGHDFALLDKVLGGNGVSTTSGPSLEKWRTVFKAVYSGGFYQGAYYGQGVSAHWWGRSPTGSTDSEAARGANYLGISVNPDAAAYLRLRGLAVRCVI